MERGAGIEEDTGQLKGIVALLLAFAAFADRVCLLPLPARARLMSFLWPAEAVARDYVADELGFAPSQMMRSGDDVVDAAHLAVSFRALAIALLGLAARLAAIRCDGPYVRPARSVRARSIFGHREHGQSRPIAQPFDTS
jgi:hypothetical protein